MPLAFIYITDTDLNSKHSDDMS